MKFLKTMIAAILIFTPVVLVLFNFAQISFDSNLDIKLKDFNTEEVENEKSENSENAEEDIVISEE